MSPCSMSLEQNLECKYEILTCQCETLNVNIKSWMPIWKPRHIPKLCEIRGKLPNERKDINENKDFGTNDLKESCSGFVEFTSNLV